MNRSRDEFLPCAGLAANEHCGVGQGDGFDVLQHASQRRVLADDVSEVVFGANLFFEVRLLAV